MLNIKKTFAWAAMPILMTAIFSPSRVFALDPQKTINQYGHNIWTRQNGLPTNTISIIVQTPDRYIWLGTSAGLFRFDGVSFNLVNTDPEDSKNLETVLALCEDEDGSLWIDTAFNLEFPLASHRDAILLAFLCGREQQGKTWIPLCVSNSLSHCISGEVSKSVRRK